VKKYRSLGYKKTHRQGWPIYDKWLLDEAMLRLTIQLLIDPEDRSG